MRDTVRKGKFAVTGEAVENKCETFVTLHIARAFEEFVERRSK